MAAPANSKQVLLPQPQYTNSLNKIDLVTNNITDDKIQAADLSKKITPPVSVWVMEPHQAMHTPL